MKKKVGVSIVICTYNGSERIKKVLLCLKEQIQVENIQWEIIVVDNNSTDDTYEIASKISSKFDNSLKVVKEIKQGLIHARIKGYECSQYDVVSYIDDDNYVANDWVFNVYKIMNENLDVGACGGYSELYMNDKVSIPAWFEQFKVSYAVGPQSENSSGYVQYLWGAGLSIRREVLDVLFTKEYNLLLTGRIGTDLSSGEDTEITLATNVLGWKLFYTDELRLKHDIGCKRLPFEYLKKLQNAFGKSYAYLAPYIFYTKYNKTHKNHLKYSSSWLFNYCKNILKLMPYVCLFALTFFSSKRRKYHLRIIYIMSFNRELLKLRGDYRNLYTHVKYLQGLKNKNL